MDAELTLEKAKKNCQSKKAIVQQHQQLQGSKQQSIVVDEIGRSDRGRQNYMWRSVRNQCPALGVTCRKCRRIGHYAKVCLSKTAAAAMRWRSTWKLHDLDADAEYSEDYLFLGAVSTRASDEDTAWTVKVRLKGEEMLFKIDTGAAVTIVSEPVYRKLKGLKLDKLNRILYGPAQQALKVLGQFTGNLSIRKHSHRENIYVVQQLHSNLLGLPAITALRLIKRVNTTYGGAGSILEQFPKVFTGLGTLGGKQWG